jgi:hypothetical protein
LTKTDLACLIEDAGCLRSLDVEDVDIREEDEVDEETELVGEEVGV